mmetsp:Transcript_16303/g.21126  ORF Transcript_16303/g.21126 Transcript_16303/m.21126 type:complete len:116 (-) Transcript_16303:71-418(-)
MNSRIKAAFAERIAVLGIRIRNENNRPSFKLTTNEDKDHGTPNENSPLSATDHGAAPNNDDNNVHEYSPFIDLSSERSPHRNSNINRLSSDSAFSDSEIESDANTSSREWFDMIE